MPDLWTIKKAVLMIASFPIICEHCEKQQNNVREGVKGVKLIAKHVIEKRKSSLFLLTY